MGNGDDIYLNGFSTDYNNLPLDPNQSYTVTQNITIPNTLTGQGYLLIKTDSDNNQAENNETDNIKSVAINVTTPDVNLVVTDITTPNIVASGQTFSLSWTVQNQVSIATNPSFSNGSIGIGYLSNWSDSIVYSTDDIFGNEDDVNLPID